MKKLIFYLLIWMGLIIALNVLLSFTVNGYAEWSSAHAKTSGAIISLIVFIGGVLIINILRLYREIDRLYILNRITMYRPDYYHNLILGSSLKLSSDDVTKDEHEEKNNNEN